SGPGPRILRARRGVRGNRCCCSGRSIVAPGWGSRAVQLKVDRSCMRDNECVAAILILAGAALLSCSPADPEAGGERSGDPPVMQSQQGGTDTSATEGSDIADDDAPMSGDDSGTAADTGRAQQEPSGATELTIYFS